MKLLATICIGLLALGACGGEEGSGDSTRSGGQPNLEDASAAEIPCGYLESTVRDIDTLKPKILVARAELIEKEAEEAGYAPVLAEARKLRPAAEQGPTQFRKAARAMDRECRSF